MNLYRFEVTIEKKVTHVVVAAENDEKAFSAVEVELEKFYLKLPNIQDISLYERKKIRNGSGFVLDKPETTS
ncbi:DUF3906 family protein [Metabacillus arenae]|uniref:DUF3906 family protein n=1 Tax=Metabacillus arenae TaxID=2771434 RepID=A0A926NH92_9BACI|nr:DUF3906 family protein [Metabacillus arenae]MBD1379973.1 DUF3906 family protein [Metabacillus arenae]